MITTTAAGRSAFVLAIAAAAAAVIVAVLAGTAHAQGDASTVFSTSPSLATGWEQIFGPLASTVKEWVYDLRDEYVAGSLKPLREVLRN